MTNRDLLEHASAEALTDSSPSPTGASAFAALAHILHGEVRDLADMAASGTLADEMRYGGGRSRRASRHRP